MWGGRTVEHARDRCVAVNVRRMMRLPAGRVDGGPAVQRGLGEHRRLGRGLAAPLLQELHAQLAPVHPAV